MNILSLDIGTKTGWAFGTLENFSCGTETLATAKEITAWRAQRLDRRCDPRVSRMAALVRHLASAPTSELSGVDYLVFEDVEFSSFTKQTQLWASLRAAVWSIASPSIKCECVPVTTLKKFACGHGGATKEMMMGAVARYFPARFKFDGKNLFDINTQTRLTDDTADAIHLLRWGHQNLARAKP